MLMAKSVRLHPGADEALRKLEDELRAEGYRASRPTIVAAILCNIPAPQVAGMVPWYVKRRARKAAAGRR
jgi:hypothetical protein